MKRVKAAWEPQAQILASVGAPPEQIETCGAFFYMGVAWFLDLLSTANRSATPEADLQSVLRDVTEELHEIGTQYLVSTARSRAN